MAKTNMTERDRTAFTQVIGKLCNSAMRFMKCPVENAALIAAHNTLIPHNLIEAVQTLNYYETRVHGVVSQSAEHVVDIGGDRAIWLRIYSDDDNLWNVPKQLTARYRKATLAKDVICGRNACQRPVMPSEFLHKTLGDEQFNALVEWGVQVVALEKEICEVVSTFDAVLSMASTIGQLYRMVPEMGKYAPDQLRNAYRMQQKQSVVPGDWPAFDKRKVVALLESLAKFHLLHSIDPDGDGHYKPRLNGDQFTWCHTLELETRRA